MQFRNRNKAKHRIRATLELTPLITVVFNLLLFFMLSSTFVVQSSIQIQSPISAGTTRLEAKDLSVTLQYGEGGPDGKGRIYVNNDEVTSWDALSQRLAEEIRQRPNAVVLVRPDARVETGRLVNTLSIATSAGVQYYAIATEPAKAAE